MRTKTEVSHNCPFWMNQIVTSFPFSPTWLRHTHQMPCPRPPRQISEQSFKFKGHWLSVSIRTIYFYINIHLHNSSPVACREKTSRLLLSDELKMYLWEYPRDRVGIVMGWVMPLTKLWEKFAFRVIATATKRYLIINFEEKTIQRKKNFHQHKAFQLLTDRFSGFIQDYYTSQLNKQLSNLLN